MTKFLIFSIVLILFTIPLVAQTTVFFNNPSAPPTVGGFTFNVTTGSTSQTVLSVTPVNARGAALPYTRFAFWLSDKPTGGTPTTYSCITCASVTIIGSTGMFLDLTTTTGVGVQLPLDIQAGDSGTVRIGVLDSAKTNWYPVAQAYNGLRAVGPKITTANYAFIDEFMDRFRLLAFNPLAAKGNRGSY